MGGIVVKGVTSACSANALHQLVGCVVNLNLRGASGADGGSDGIVAAVPTAHADAGVHRIADTRCCMTGQAVGLMMGFTGVGTGAASTAIPRAVTS